MSYYPVGILARNYTGVVLPVIDTSDTDRDYKAITEIWKDSKETYDRPYYRKGFDNPMFNLQPVEPSNRRLHQLFGNELRDEHVDLYRTRRHEFADPIGLKQIPNRDRMKRDYMAKGPAVYTRSQKTGLRHDLRHRRIIHEYLPWKRDLDVGVGTSMYKDAALPSMPVRSTALPVRKQNPRGYASYEHDNSYIPTPTRNIPSKGIRQAQEELGVSLHRSTKSKKPIHRYPQFRAVGPRPIQMPQSRHHPLYSQV
jgi:hypothetical protein